MSIVRLTSTKAAARARRKTISCKGSTVGRVAEWCVAIIECEEYERKLNFLASSPNLRFSFEIWWRQMLEWEKLVNKHARRLSVLRLFSCSEEFHFPLRCECFPEPRSLNNLVSLVRRMSFPQMIIAWDIFGGMDSSLTHRAWPMMIYFTVLRIDFETIPFYLYKL